MPLYEYECEACHKRTEKRQKFSDPELTECPHCGGKLERTITAPAFQFAGGGWYKDGYGSAKPSAAAGEASSGANADAKPAATVDSVSAAAASPTAASSANAPPPAAPAQASTPAPSASNSKD